MLGAISALKPCRTTIIGSVTSSARVSRRYLNRDQSRSCAPGNVSPQGKIKPLRRGSGWRLATAVEDAAAARVVDPVIIRRAADRDPRCADPARLLHATPTRRLLNGPGTPKATLVNGWSTSSSRRHRSRRSCERCVVVKAMLPNVAILSLSLCFVTRQLIRRDAPSHQALDRFRFRTRNNYSRAQKITGP